MANVNDSLRRWSQWVLAPARAKSVFRSTDVDETRLAIARVYAQHELDVVGPGQRLDAAFAAWDLGRVAVGYVRHGAEVIARPGKLGSYYGINMAVNGSAVLRCDRSDAELAPASAVVMSPTQEIVMRRSADCEEVALRIDRSALEAELSRTLGRDVDAPVVFDPAMRLTTCAGLNWKATLAFALNDIRNGTGSLDHPLVRSRVEQLLIDQLLLAQPHNFSEQLKTGYRPARPPAVRRAIDIIRARAADADVGQFREHGHGQRLRGLQQGFRDHLGITPLEYMREVRLTRARDDLLAVGPGDGRSVTEIAYRWGFAHLARFAGYYKHRYGESPSETLRR